MSFPVAAKKERNVFSCLIERNGKLSKKKKKNRTKIFCLAENMKRNTSKKMNAETDVMHIAMKKAISSEFVAVTSQTSVTCKFGFFFWS